MPTLPVLLALLAAAAPGTPAAPPDRPAPDGAADPAAAEPGEDLDAPPGKAGPHGPDPDFDAPPAGASLVFGPVKATRPMISADGGWLKSGLRLLAGAGGGIDLMGRVDTFYPGVSGGGQHGVYLGLRWSSEELQPLRLSTAFEVGEVFVAGRDAASGFLTLRLEVAVGAELDGWRPYGRGGFALLHDSVTSGEAWGTAAEVGLGVERTLGSFVVAAEGGSLLQPGVRAIATWRVRVGHAF